MEDKFDSIMNVFGKNKNSLLYMLIAYIVITGIIIAIIWWPKEKKYATYEKVNMQSKKTEMAQNHINTVSNLFKNNKTEEVKNLISNEYVRYTGKSETDIVKELEAAGYFSSNVKVSGMNIYEDGDTYVYSTTIYSNKSSRKINIIEKNPYNYSIVFDDFYSYDTRETTVTKNNIKFTIDSLYSNLKYVEVKMRIENLNQSYARFDFNSTVGVQAVLEDGTRYTATNLVSTESHTNIQPNMTVSKTFVFEIPAQLQNGIEYIAFNRVSLEFSSMDIKVSI